MKYLKQFVIGSSYLIFLPFFLLVKNSLPEKTYSYYTYTITAPVYFGVWNVLSLVLAEYFGLSMRERFMLVTPLALLCIVLFAKITKKYKFTREKWLNYSLLLFSMYLILWNVIVYNIELNM